MADSAHEYLMQERDVYNKSAYVSQHIIRDQYSAPNTTLLSQRPKKPQYLTGWRRGVVAGACVVTLSLIINILVIVVFTVRFGAQDGLTVLYEGECSRVSNINLGIHLVINGLATLMLSASNYCMQVLSAPTRHEVDKAHTRRTWLDIGISSVRNLSRIQRWRVYVWIVLVISSLPLHLVYNSVVFYSKGAYSYVGIVVSPGFINAPTYHGPLNVSTTNEVLGNSPTLAEVQRLQIDAASFEKLDNTDCIATYHKALVTDHSDLILISSFYQFGNNPDDESAVYFTFRDGDFYISFDGIASWICDTFNSTALNLCLYTGQTPDPSTWSIQGSKIDYCLSRRTPEICTIKSSTYLMLIVIVCNFAKSAALLTVLFKFKDEPLVTVGDAVSSFMTAPDYTTLHACLISKNDVASGLFWTEMDHIRPWKRRRIFRFVSVSRKRRWFSFLICLFGIAMVSLFLGLAIKGLQKSQTLSIISSTPSLRQIWNSGFGLSNEASFWIQAPKSLYGNMILSNLPQLIFSMFYFIYNGLYTVMSLAAEWSSFSRSRKGLRVSKPVGSQRSTYYLQLPYRYAVPLVIVSTLMHWFISQSFFLLSVEFYGSSSVDNFTYATCGYSGIAIIFGLGLASLMLIVIFVHGLRKLTFDIPPVGSCSIAISAACHPPSDGQDPSMPLQWGVVVAHNRQGNVDVGHCSFSSGHVLPPVKGERYGTLGDESKARRVYSRDS